MLRAPKSLYPQLALTLHSWDFCRQIVGENLALKTMISKLNSDRERIKREVPPSLNMSRVAHAQQAVSDINMMMPPPAPATPLAMIPRSSSIDSAHLQGLASADFSGLGSSSFLDEAPHLNMLFPSRY
jgi:hypothetical protein